MSLKSLKPLEIIKLVKIKNDNIRGSLGVLNILRDEFTNSKKKVEKIIVCNYL